MISIVVPAKSCSNFLTKFISFSIFSLFVGGSVAQEKVVVQKPSASVSDLDLLCLVRSGNAVRSANSIIDEFRIGELDKVARSNKVQKMLADLNLLITSQKSTEEELDIRLEEMGNNLNSLLVEADLKSFETRNGKVILVIPAILQYRSAQNGNIKVRGFTFHIFVQFTAKDAAMIGSFEVPFDLKPDSIPRFEKRLHWLGEDKSVSGKNYPFIIEAMYKNSKTYDFCSYNSKQPSFLLPSQILDAKDAKVQQSLRELLRTLTNKDLDRLDLLEDSLTQNRSMNL